jgi:peptide/nickel transport system ATP-binding protein
MRTPDAPVADAPPAAVLSVRDLTVTFASEGAEAVDAVRGVTLGVAPGEYLGLVGESGSGKTTTMLAMLGLLPGNATIGGRVEYAGEDMVAGGEPAFRARRWKEIAMVFQGAMNSLNPVLTIGRQIEEVLKLHMGMGDAAARRARVAELLELVGIPGGRAGRYAHELSGGMRQRAVIAMAIACEPRVLLADEPTTALDAMVQAQVLNLLIDIGDELGTAVILVTHDLGVVATTCHRVAIMKDGEVIERGDVASVFRSPTHPYTTKMLEGSEGL